MGALAMGALAWGSWPGGPGIGALAWEPWPGVSGLGALVLGSWPGALAWGPWPVRTDGQNIPCILQDIVPLGPLPKKGGGGRLLEGRGAIIRANTVYIDAKI